MKDATLQLEGGRWKGKWCRMLGWHRMADGFGERRRKEGADAPTSAVYGAASRLRPIVMTSAAMLAGMLPMALGMGEGGSQTAPLGRAVAGGLAASTAAALFVLPAIYALVMGRAGAASASLDPDDIESRHYTAEADQNNGDGSRKENGN